MPQTKRYTLEEFIANPDFKHYELVAGEPVPLARYLTPVAHGITQLRLGAALTNHVETNQLGLATIGRLVTRRDPNTIREPDVMFASWASLEGVDVATNEPWPTADLAVEVRSEGESLPDLDEKTEEYFGVGIREVWIVDWRRHTVTTHRPSGTTRTYIETDILDGRDIVPGFRYPLAPLFKLSRFG